MVKACSAGSTNRVHEIPEAVPEPPAGMALGPLGLHPVAKNQNSEMRTVVLFMRCLQGTGQFLSEPVGPISLTFNPSRVETILTAS
jgi:hypothetical protein